MSRALGPRAPLTGSSAAPGWMVLGCIAVPAALLAVVWAAAKLAAALAGGRAEGYGFGFCVAVLTARFARAWPGTPTALVAALTIAAFGLAVAGAVCGWRRFGEQLFPVPGDPVAALAAHRRQHVTMDLQHTAEKAVQLRASLYGRNPALVAPADAGQELGDLMRPGRAGPALYSNWEDTGLAIMGPRSGKTTARAVPLTLDAPGPVLATSNKSDLWAATRDIRGRRGKVWLFDPCSITWQRQEFTVDLLEDVRSAESANRLASHFVLTIEDPSRKDLWGPAAQTLLTCLFLAARLDSRTLHDVALWLDQPAMPLPASILKEHGFTKFGSSLQGTQNGAPETRDGIYETARTAAKALRDDEVVKWVTPQPGLPAFSPRRFVDSADTLHLLSESLSYAAPLIAATTDLVILNGLQRAQQSGGRLDAPLVIILDEAANICRIARLPDYYSFLGSHGILPLTILQSYEQGQAVWGDSGMAALWGAATCKLIGAGVDSPRLTKDLSELVGQHDVTVRSIGLGEGRGISENISFRRQALLEAADVRALRKGTALLLTSGNRPAIVQLRNWFSGPRAAEISASIRRAQELITQGALAAVAPGSRP